MKRQEIAIWLVLVSVVVLVGMDFWNRFESRVQSVGTSKAESLLDYAAQLKANQLYAQSAEAYDAYLKESNLSDPEKAKIDFNTATMLLDQLGDAEGALSRLLRVTDLYQGVDIALVKEARKLSAACLEKMGRSGAAERKLIESSRLGADADIQEQTDENDILAKIGERTAISRTEFEQTWRDLPAQVQSQMKKEEFLKDLVSSRLFAEAAKRKGLDRDPAIQRRLKMLEESLLAEKLLSSELNVELKIPESDIQMFFEANRSHFARPASVEIAHLVTGDSVTCELAKAALQAGTDFVTLVKRYSTDPNTRDKEGRLGKISLLPKPLDKNQPHDPFLVPVPGIGQNREFVIAAFSLANIGDVTGPIKTERGYHLIRLLGKDPGDEMSLEECRPNVEMELKRIRLREKQDQLLADLIKTQKVRMFPERIGQ